LEINIEVLTHSFLAYCCWLAHHGRNHQLAVCPPGKPLDDPQTATPMVVTSYSRRLSPFWVCHESNHQQPLRVWIPAAPIWPNGCPGVVFGLVEEEKMILAGLFC